MEFRFGRYRLQLAIERRSSGVCPDHIMDGERTDRDLALLEQAEREYRDTLWREQSLLGGSK